MAATPPRGTLLDSRHFLANRRGSTVFAWKGTGWSTPGSGWNTSAKGMAALGWKYVGPVEIAAAGVKVKEVG